MLLRATGLSKEFVGVRALQSVDFELAAGEVHALMGENGAGKSTLVKVLTGVHARDSGSIKIDGKLVAPASPRDAEALGLSTVYQEIGVIPHLSVAENIMLGRQPTRLGMVQYRQVNEAAEEALARMGLKLDVRRPIASLAPAVQQLVAIARALSVRAKILTLDEPTASLDQAEAAQLFSIMEGLKNDGPGIIFITHFLDQVYAVSDRITVLRDGQRVATGTTTELPRLRLIEAILGRQSGELKQSPTGGSGKVSAPIKGTSRSANSDANAPILNAQGLRREKVIGPIDLSLYPGEVVGLAGLLGSGRSETARMLFGVEPAEHGALRMADPTSTDTGKPPRTPREAIARGLAFLPEERKLEGIVPNLSVHDNLILALQASRGVTRLLPRKEQELLVNHYIRALRIKTASPATPIAELSGGNQQKVLIARWLALQPQVVILDEPTRGIDIGAKAEIERLIAELSERGVATVLISSELEEVTRNCQRVLVLRDRRQVAELRGAEITPGAIMNTIAAPESQ